MIRYSLVCEAGHGFESWFRDLDAYDDQAARGFLSCPSCGSAKVDKAIMAPQVARKDRVRGGPARPDAAPQPVALVSPEETELRAKLRELRDHMVKNSDYVGPSFAEEARKMHLGEIDHRSIHGEASPEEARALVEDGVEFMPLPTVPEDRN